MKLYDWDKYGHVVAEMYETNSVAEIAKEIFKRYGVYVTVNAIHMYSRRKGINRDPELTKEIHKRNTPKSFRRFKYGRV